MALAAWPGAPSCIRDKWGCIRIQPWITGTIRSRYVVWLIIPQSFSQNTPGPLIPPWNEPQNIHPCFRGIFSIIQVGSHSSPAALVTHIRVCFPGNTHVSSVQRIVSHCSLVQSICSRAHWRRATRFASEIGGFLRAICREKPSFLRALRIALPDTFQPSLVATSSYCIRLVSLELYIKRTRRSRQGVFMTGLGPDLRF